MKGTVHNEHLFVDWLSIWQVQDEHAPINNGAILTVDGAGRTIFEHVRPSRVQGSHSTSCRLKSDGRTVVASGNFGRLNRPDNLFNFAPLLFLQRANAVATFAGLPVFSVGDQGNGGNWWKCGVRFSDNHRIGGAGGKAAIPAGRLHLSRVDLTKNYACGSIGAARSLIRAISGKSVSRVKKGVGGDASVWWSNTRYMLKVYIKSLEMEAHGCNSGKVYEYARDNGIVRLELELKRRELADLGWSLFDDFLAGWNMGNVHKLFADYEKILTVENISSDAEFIDALPQRLRVTAAAFLSGRDVRSLMTRASFYRYRKALLDYGIDIADERPAQLNVKIRTIEIVPLAAPDWYWEDQA